MDQSIVIDTPQWIAMYRMLSLKSALKLETLGMKNSRGSVFALVKREYNLKGNKQSVYDQFVKLVEEAKAAQAVPAPVHPL